MKRLLVFEDLQEWRDYRMSPIFEGKTLGFVPTMGALHEGHLSLVGRSVGENDFTLASIYVNPTQFDDPNDLENYPVTLETDLELLREAGADFVLLPNDKSIYPDQYRYHVIETAESLELCGARRRGHFEGVLTIVMKLLHLADADRAYFGEKDYQQYRLIKGMADSFFMHTEIVSCPIVREEDGLAMSSRNRRLAPEEREKASAFPAILKSAESDEDAQRLLDENGFEVDYVITKDGRRFGAIKLGNVRLIDNVTIR